jgi:hypothetical protein
LAHLRRLRFVNSFIDRHGHVRHYFRRNGLKAIPLPGPFGSDEFMLAYRTALMGSSAAAGKPEIGASRTAPGTINTLVVSYYRSDP